MNIQRKSGTGFGAVIAAICIIIYLFALVQGAVRFYLSIDQCRNNAEQEFSRIAATALSAGTQGFMNERFVELINLALASSDIIEAVIISGPEGEFAFEKQAGHAVTWINNSPRFINRLSFSNQNYQRPLPIHDLRNANIRAVARVFDYNQISKILKDTLYIIVIGFSVAFLTMLLQLLLGKPVEKTAQTDENFTAKENTVAKAKEPVSESFPDDEFPTNSPKGLYSPRSNIGWEEYINDRLDSELHRCASTEKDLALVIMEFTDITSDSMFRHAADEAVSFFTSRDLLFEYGQQGILAILPGIDLEAGISKAEIFHQRMTEKFPNKFKYNSNSSLCIGITSRSGRLLNADRLMFEGKEALNKANSDRKTSIIAFKSDPEKYRTFIASQKTQRS